MKFREVDIELAKAGWRIHIVKVALKAEGDNFTVYLPETGQVVFQGTEKALREAWL